MTGINGHLQFLFVSSNKLISDRYGNRHFQGCFLLNISFYTIMSQFL